MLKSEPPRSDSPGEAQEFYRLKRAPDGKGPIPVERYMPALDHIKNMAQFSTAANRSFPSQNDRGVNAPAILQTWTALGPGNIGGRTRAWEINPKDPDTMYTAGVAGGVWKTTSAGSSWTPLSDILSNIAVNSLAMDPNDLDVIYAGTGEGYFNGDGVRGAGIFKTTDAGASWTYLTTTNNASFHYVNDIVVSPNDSQRVYAATRTGVWKSTDGGANWALALDQSVVAGGCLDLAIRTDQGTDYILASCGTFVQATLFLNTDAGGSGVWTPVLSDPGQGRTTLAIAPSNQAIIYALSASNVGGAGGNYSLGLHKVFRSTNGGNSWDTRVSNSDPIKLNTLLLTNPVFASFVECNFGPTNQFFNQGWYDNVIAVDPVDPNRVWAGGIDLFRSDDGGANWGLASYWWISPADPHFVHADQHKIVFHPDYNGTSNKIMFVGNDGGLFKTDDARAATATSTTASCNPNNTSVTWTNLNNNYGVTQFYHGAPYPDGQTYFGGTQDNGTLRGTAAGGVVWGRLLGGDGGYVAVDPNNTNIIYAEFQNLSIQKSINGGASFFGATNGIINNGFAFIVPFIMDPSNSQRLWTGGSVMWRTTNGAANWVQASANLCSSPVSAVAVAPTNPNNVLSGAGFGCIHRTNVGLTSNSSTNWPVTSPRGGFVSWLTFDPTDANIAYATYSSFNFLPTDKHIYKSTDAGASWTGIDGTGANSIPDVPVHSIVVDPANTSRLYAGTDLGVFTSTDGGANWMQEITGFANVVTESLSLINVGGTPTLFAFTHGRGAWRVQIDGGGGGGDCTIQCPPNVTVSNANNQCGAAVNYTPPTTMGNCGTVICSPPQGAVFPVGTTTVTCTTAAGPNCSFTVTVVDTQPPAVTCQLNLTAVTPKPGDPCAVVNFAVTATDNCPNVSLVCRDQNGVTVTSGQCFPRGFTVISCTASDSAGNISGCGFNITVFDVRVQDDSNPALALLWDSVTGLFRFCGCGSFQQTGFATPKVKGSTFTLEGSSSTYRVIGRCDGTVNKGTASLQRPPGTTICNITDRDITNNFTICP